MTSISDHGRSAMRCGVMMSALAFLAACGGNEGTQATESKANSMTPANAAAAPAEAKAIAQTPPSTSCGPMPAWGGFDYWGIRLNMSKKEADEVLACLGGDFAVKEDLERFTVRSYQVPLPVIRVKRGDVFTIKREEELTVYFAGAPDHLRVVHIHKKMDFPSTKPESRRASGEAMAAAYGPFDRVEARVSALNSYGQVKAVDGSKIAPEDRKRNFSICAIFAGSDTSGFDDAWRPEKYSPTPEGCGVSIAYTVHAKSDVDDEISRFSMGTADYEKTREALRESVAAANLPRE